MSRREEAGKLNSEKYRPGEKDPAIAAGVTCQFATLRLALPVVLNHHIDAIDARQIHSGDALQFIGEMEVKLNPTHEPRAEHSSFSKKPGSAEHFPTGV
jgi:hypothetical protein